MEQTPKLSLPYILGSQAQKHVTHNEALKRLDILVQSAVLDRLTATPPASPADGDCYIVAAGADDAWTGKAGQIAAFQDGAWSFYAPRPGWSAYVASEAVLVFWDGSNWESQAAETRDRLGVNTTANAMNRLAVKSDVVLFSHDDVTPGSGDMRTVINKAGSAAIASLLFQSAWSGRAEIGLAGSDDFSLKTSADGVTFRQSLVASALDGSVRFPQGVSDLGIGSIGGLRNLLINGDGGINQRGFAGGALAAGAYGPDRWRAGAGGCDVSIASVRWTLDGALEQVVEAPSLAGRTVTVSVEDPTAEIAVAVGGESGVIAPGSGRRGTTLTLAGGETGDVTLRLTAAGGADFGKVQLEEGPVATPFERRPAALELLLCRRYFQALHPTENGALALAMAQTTNQYVAVLPLPATLRAPPAVTFSGAFRVYRYDGAWADVTDVTLRSLEGAVLRLTVTTDTYPGSGLAVFFPFAGASLGFDAEL